MAVTILSGVYPILATPFRADRAVDVEDLARLIDFIIDSGADGIVFPGVASEFETLEAAERTHLVDVVAAHIAGRLPLVVGVSAAGGAGAAAHAAQAKAVGAVAVMAVAPPSLAGHTSAIRDYYARVAAEGVPLILQNAPPPAGCALSADDVIDLVRTIEGIRYVKEETLPCGQRITRILAAELPALAGVFGGAGGRYITDELARGACGTMPACELTDLHVAPVRAASGRRRRRRARALLPDAAAAQFPGGVPDGDDEGSAARARHHCQHRRPRGRPAAGCRRSHRAHQRCCTTSPTCCRLRRRARIRLDLR